MCNANTLSIVLSLWLILIANINKNNMSVFGGKWRKIEISGISNYILKNCRISLARKSKSHGKCTTQSTTEIVNRKDICSQKYVSGNVLMIKNTYYGSD